MAHNFPPSDCRKADWRPLIMSAMTWISDVGDGNVKFNEIIDYIENLPGFPGWHVWGDYNGKANQMGRRYISLEATALKMAGVLDSPRRGTYRIASDEAPVVEPSVVHKAVLTVVPDPEPEIKAPEPVEAPVEPPVTDGPTTHPLYLSSERARRIAIEQTRCFGFYSERAATCDDCPLAGLCLAARGANVAEANARVEAWMRREAERVEAERVEAERVEAERVEGEARAASLAATVANALGDSTEDAAEATEDASPVMTGKTVQIPWSIICSGCGKKTEPNEEVVAIEDHGTFHKGCAPQNTTISPSN